MGEWLPMQTDLHQHQATLSIADATGLDPDAVVGKLLRVWGWARERTITGHLSGGVLTMIDRVVGVAGFGAAMSRAVSDDGTPWVVAGEGKLTFPKWEKWLSNGAKARMSDSDRKRRTRAGQKSESNRTNVQKNRTPSSSISSSSSVSDSSSEEGMQGEKPPGPFHLADALAMVHDPILAGIGDLWSDWMRTRFNAPKHKRPTRRAAELALATLGKWTPAQRRQSLESTIANGWQGIFEPKENGNGKRTGNTAHRDNKRANEYPETLTVPVARVPVNGSKGWDSETPL